MTLIVSFVVILLVAALVGRVCSKARPGEHRGSAAASWPGVLGGEADGDPGHTVHLPDTGHHSGWAHSHSPSHGHADGGGWGGGFGGGDSSGGGSV